MEGIIMLVVMFGVLYFFMIRPENKRKKEAENMRNSLKKGDQITTIGGILGRIVMVKDDTIVIETSDDRVRLELAKWAVSTNNSRQPEGKKEKKEAEPAKAEQKKLAEPAKPKEEQKEEVPSQGKE